MIDWSFRIGSDPRALTVSVRDMERFFEAISRADEALRAELAPFQEWIETRWAEEVARLGGTGDDQGPGA